MKIENNILLKVYDNDIKNGKVVIPDGVTKISCDAFNYRRRLKSITIPGSVIEIEPYAFYDCEKLTSVTIGNGVTNIGKQTFAHCHNIKNIIIPDSVTSIEWSAFYECDNLVTEIKAYKAFKITPEGGIQMSQ